jgi:hypothetical protein
MKIWCFFLMFLSLPLWAVDYQYEEQKLSLYDVKNKLVSETTNIRAITTDSKLKRISVESTEVTLNHEFRNKNIYKIYKRPNGKWILEDSLDIKIRLELVIQNPDQSEWPIRSYRAEGPSHNGGTQKIDFEQTLAGSKGRIEYQDWKGRPQGHLIILGKPVSEAQYLTLLKDVKH